MRHPGGTQLQGVPSWTERPERSAVMREKIVGINNFIEIVSGWDKNNT
jgi:hypothetical protein